MKPAEPTEAPASAVVAVASTCWACGAVQHKHVRPTTKADRQFHWQCRSCDVSWSGPGTAA